MGGINCGSTSPYNNEQAMGLEKRCAGSKIATAVYNERYIKKLFYNHDGALISPPNPLINLFEGG